MLAKPKENALSVPGGMNSKTVSLRPPVLKAMTGVPAEKYSCCTMPLGSNSEGMRPKSQPRLSRTPSVKNSFGSALEDDERGQAVLERKVFANEIRSEKEKSPS